MACTENYFFYSFFYNIKLTVSGVTERVASNLINTMDSEKEMWKLTIYIDSYSSESNEYFLIKIKKH